MPVRSPTINATLPQDIVSQDPAKINMIPAEETNENVSKEKLNNLKLMMKTFIMGALREKEQVNYS
jgi:RNA polymerase I-specific transcription initiation factor RRN3